MIRSDELTAILPSLTAFSRSLVRKDKSRSDDLLQDTLLRMIEKQHLFQDGTNLKAWAFKLMHNIHHNYWRSHDYARNAIGIDEILSFTDRPREKKDSEGMEEVLRAGDVKIDDMIDLKKRWATMQPKWQAIMACYVDGDTYEEIQQKFGYVSVKSTMNRIREHLARP